MKREYIFMGIALCFFTAVCFITIHCKTVHAGNIGTATISNSQETNEVEQKSHSTGLTWQSIGLIIIGGGCAILRFAKSRKRREKMYDMYDANGNYTGDRK